MFNLSDTGSSLLSTMLAHRNNVVDPVNLAISVWGGSLPPTWRTMISVEMSNVRRFIAGKGLGEIKTIYKQGYRLEVASHKRRS